MTQQGLHEFTVMPFGLKNSYSTFQTVVDKLLSGCKQYAVAYIDDTGMYNKSWEECLNHLEIVLQTRKGAGLTIKPRKCQRACTEVLYLGHKVGGGEETKGIHDQIHKRVTGAPNKKNKFDPLGGLTSYYRKIVCDFGSIAPPLNRNKFPSKVT